MLLYERKLWHVYDVSLYPILAQTRSHSYLTKEGCPKKGHKIGEKASYIWKRWCYMIFFFFKIISQSVVQSVGSKSRFQRHFLDFLFKTKFLIVHRLIVLFNGWFLVQSRFIQFEFSLRIISAIDHRLPKIIYVQCCSQIISGSSLVLHLLTDYHEENDFFVLCSTHGLTLRNWQFLNFYTNPVLNWTDPFWI